MRKIHCPFVGYPYCPFDAFGPNCFKSEVSIQLQRFFTDCMTLFEGIRMRSVVISCWDDSVRDAFTHGVMKLEKSWRCGTAFVL